ncbi:MAG: hypothetical protein Q8S31_07035 [Alphaproteobacteria bacterium]|nr:hypothetical protein [Alphaproteobacteria bacterium]
MLKKKIYFFVIFFVLSGNVFALNLEKEIAYYRDIKKPLEEFLEDLNEFRETTPGIIFRTPLKDDSLVEFDYKSSCYFANHFMELYDFYDERLFSLVNLWVLGSVDPYSIEDEETLANRQKIIDAIELIFHELEGICEAYLLPEKIEKINIMSQPKIGYKGTLKMFQKIRTFVEKHATIFNRIYIHERDIVIFSESINDDVEPKIVPVLNLPILKFEDIKKSSERALKHLDAVTAFYVEKFSVLLDELGEGMLTKKDAKPSMLDRFKRKKKEIESHTIADESNAINIDNAPLIKRRSSSLLKSLSPRSRTQSLKKISLEEIDKVDSDIELQSTELNTSEEIKPIKKRSSSILKALSPRLLTPRTPTQRSPHGDGLNRGSSDSKISPKKIVPESSPRPKSSDDYIRCKRSNSLPHSDSDIIPRSDIISKLEKLHLGNDMHMKISKKDSKSTISFVAVSPRMEKELKKQEKKHRKKEKKDKKRQKSSAKSVDKFEFSGPYENPLNE